MSKNQLDYNDPDCVVRQQGKQLLLWVPTDWVHTFALTKVPLRGRQIAYNDSGEGDAQIAELNKEGCLLYTSPSPRDKRQSRMPSSA